MAKRRRRSKKWISWLFFLVLLIVAGIVCYLVYDNYFNDDKKEPEKVETEIVEDEKKDDEEKTDEEEEQEIVKKEEVPQYDGEDPNESEAITGAITYAGVSGSNLMIRVNIDQYLSGGTCNLSIKEYGTVIYSDSAALINSASTTTCEGFDVATAITGGGNFEIIIDVNADGKSGTITGEANV